MARHNFDFSYWACMIVKMVYFSLKATNLETRDKMPRAIDLSFRVRLYMII